LKRQDETRLGQPLRFLLRRYELLQRQFDPSRHGYGLHPQAFLDFVDATSFEVDPAFLRTLRRYHGPQAAKSTPGPEKADKREVNSVAKLFAVMAVDWLGYQPGEDRSSAPREIADMAAAKGISITEETVLKYLRTGTAAFSKEWQAD